MLDCINYQSQCKIYLTLSDYVLFDSVYFSELNYKLICYNKIMG